MLENAILFVGIGPNRYKSDEIIEENNVANISNNYGSDSVFYTAAKTAETFGADNLFFLNLDSWEDIKKHKNNLKDLEFDYIVPLDLYLDETYYDSDYNKKLTYTQLFLTIIHDTISTVIMTGIHASGYENLTDYIEHENNVVSTIGKYLNNLQKENLIYVANNLEDYQYSNAVLACMMAVTDYDTYPVSSLLGKAVFDIDYCDVAGNLCFFKNSDLVGTTVENLLNFSDDNTKRLVTVNKILHYFRFHDPGTERYIGTSYSEYKKVQIAQILDNYLQNLKGYIITDYDITSVTDVLTEEGTVYIILQYDVWPKFTVERYKINSTT